ncbi:MAG TPA: two-component regulator propeller domain-containing protein [Sediminibacterium sp.]|nr:two-component regulator propeller domain-containing protein [Sediminibacterium sp.]
MLRILLHGFLVVLLPGRHSAAAQVPIGQWREHFNYKQTIQVLKGDQIYCATATNVFAVNGGTEISRYSKTNGLNDIGVSCIGWDDVTGQLVIAYENSNLDILKDGIVRNIPDIRQSNITGNKSINQIYCRDGIAYLASGIGIIAVDLTRYEIKDTWVIGNNGTQTNVWNITSDNSHYYAATDEGLKKAPTTQSNLANYANWETISGHSGLAAGPVEFAGFLNNQILVRKTDSIFIQNGSNWMLLYYDSSWNIIRATVSGNKLLLCQNNPAGQARVVQVSATGSIDRVISQPQVISLPLSAITDGNAVWVADQYEGLSRFSTTVERFIPNGPAGISSGSFAFSKGDLFAAAGAVNRAWNYLYNRDGLLRFSNGEWSNKSAFNTPILDSVLDLLTLAADPADGSVWAGSFGGGLVHFGDASVTVYKQNSSLQPAVGDPGSYRVSGLVFDRDQYLWISNYGAPQPLHVRKKDGSWKSISIPFQLTENATAQLVADDFGQLWIQSPKNNGLICYQYGNIDNNSDDRWKLYQQGIGNGNLPDNNVLSIAKDKNNSIWVGTDNGIGIISCNADLFTAGGCDAVLPVVQQDRFAGYLFKGERVQSIAVDGDNRKWIGTLNGAWLISSDGKKTIHHFTASNSPLLSNDVRQIGVDPVTGEVFFATFKGICSFRSTATEAAEAIGHVLVFPNPVPTGYNGTIAIRGLAENSSVKITELNGRLVFQTRSQGGQAIWNGRDYNGHKAASGLYLVLIRDDAGREKIATKIIITSGR